MSDPVISTAAGAVRGQADAVARAFFGIPYAAPPTGAARFGAPVPHQPWTGVRDATRPGPTAPQPNRGGFGALDMAPFFGPGWIPGADYLTVNVWTPPDAVDRPVMVFVHGGGFVAGSTLSPLYDGTAFARDGVVLVTVNYRLGVAGFLSLPGAPDNRGLLDVVAALRWVRDNIGAFGGDPRNVTLFGQSAGATITGAVAARPDARQLMRRAIVQSGNGMGAFDREQAATVTHAAAERLGIEPTLDDFAQVPDKRLVEVSGQLARLNLRTASRFDPLVGLSPFSIVLDRQPAETIAGEVSMLIGTNTEEGNLYLAPGGLLDTSTAEDIHDLAARIDTDPVALVARYREQHPGAGWGELRSAILGDALFRTGSARLAEAHAQHSMAPTHLYEFNWRSAALDDQLGAAHAIELPFVFDRLDLDVLRGPRALLGPGEPPAALAAEMHGAWIRYAKTGDPGWSQKVMYRFTG
ncbi:carboxylesterase/lipase family protein [Mycolicibacterium sp. XJ870]